MRGGAVVSRASDLAQELESAAIRFADADRSARKRRAVRELDVACEAWRLADLAETELHLVALAFAAAVRRGD